MRISPLVLLLASIVTSTAAMAAPLPFDQALEQIVKRSTAVAAQRASLEQTRAQGVPTRLSFLPTLSAQAIQSTAGAALLNTENSRRAQLTADLNVFRFGADYLSIRAADFQEQSQQALLDSQILKAEDDAVTALIDLIQASQERQIQAKILATLQESQQIARQRYARGFLAAQEVEKLGIDLDNSKAQLDDAVVRENNARAQVEALLGHAEVEGRWPWQTRLASVQLASLEQPELSQRPDWRASLARVESLDRLASRNLRLMLPSVDATFGYVFYDQVGNSPQWTGVLTISLPLFDQLSHYSSYRAGVFARQGEEYNLEQVKRTARQEWGSSRDTFRVSLESARSREKTLVSARRLYEDALRRLHAGRMSANDLAVEQNRLFSSELYTVQAWASAHKAFARLCHSAGLRLEECR